MGSILKKFGQGILYLFVLPLLLVAVAIFGVYGIFLFIILMIKSIILFFKGKSLQSDLPEDIEAKRILYPEKVEPKAEVEEREPIYIVDRDTDRIDEDRMAARYAIEEEKARRAIEEDRRKEIETSYDEEEEDDFDEEPLLLDNEEKIEPNIEDDSEEVEEEDFEEEEDVESEKLTVDELMDDEEEEEDIPTLEEESKIKVDDSDDDFEEDHNLIYKDWGDK